MGWILQELNEIRERMMREARDPRNSWWLKPKEDWRRAWTPDEFRFYGAWDLVLAHGRDWQPQPLPAGFQKGRPNRCGKNAWRLALRDSALTYVEGYATRYGCDEVGHSWVVGSDGW